MTPDNSRKVYYLATDFQSNTPESWTILLDYILPKAEFIEFNILYRTKELDSMIEPLSDDIIEFDKKKSKIYEKNYVRFKNSPNVEEFVRGRGFNDWLNSPLEDPSFYIKEKETLATITHEGMVIMELLEKTRRMFQAQGVNFEHKY